MINLSSCPVCNASDIDRFINCQDYFKSGEQFDILKCGNCGILFTNPVPDEDETEYYYDSEEYFSHKDRSWGITGNIYFFLRKLAIRNKYKLISKYKQHGKILDYGCGTGELADYFASKGWEAWGYEPGVSASLLLHEKKLVKAINEDDLKSCVKCFDIITMWHVLEHIQYLNKTINFLASSLKEDGLIFIAVPNYHCKDAEKYGQYWAAWDVPRHLYHFNIESLKNLFNRHKFVCRGQYDLRMDAYYISLISEKYKSGRKNYFNAIYQGFRSNRYGSSNNMNYSSILLSFEKNRQI